MRTFIVLSVIFILTSLCNAQWVQTSGPCGGHVLSLAVSATNLFAGTYGAGVFLSTNDGASWTAANTPFSGFSRMIQVGTNLFAGTDLGVFLSTNNGQSWTAVSGGLTNATVLSLAVSGTNLFAGTYGGGVFLSTNNGTSWTAINSGLTNTTVLSLAVSGTNLFAGTYGGVFLSTNNGTNWTAVNSGLTNATVLSLAVSDINLFAGINLGGVFLSTNNGTSWIHGDSGLTSYSVLSLAVSGTNLFAGTWGGVFLSTNNGTSWTKVDSGLTNTYVNAFVTSGTNLFAGTHDGGVFLSTNNGTSWDSAGLPGRSVNALAESGTNLFAGTYGGVFLSTNNGQSWTAVNNGLTNTTVLSFVVSGTNLFAGTSAGGIFLSSNNGTSWTAVSIGLTSAYVQALAVSGTNLFAGTWGDGVFLSTNNGTSWTAVNSGLANTIVSSLAVSGTNLFAGTYGAGVWRRSLSDFSITTTLTLSVTNGWNIISAPLIVGDYTKTALFPTATSESFTYNGSYVVKTTLQNGIGYWLRFSDNQSIPITGTLNTDDTINVNTGWNMIGSMSVPVPVASIGSIPGGLVTSQFFGYDGGYQTVTSIQPGSGYWVKVSGAGKLILSSSNLSSSRITIRPISDLPPTPPEGQTSPIPGEFSLEQNYPSPFNPTTVINYTLPTSAQIRLTIYNLLGQEVMTLVNEKQDAGYKSVSFNASRLPSGIYMYRLTAGTLNEVKRMILVK